MRLFRYLCDFLKAETVFRVLTDIIVKDEDNPEDSKKGKDDESLRRKRHLADMLNIILLTAPETEELRGKLTSINSQESRELFQHFYHAFSHSPCSTLCLCIIGGFHMHAAQVVLALGKEVRPIIGLIMSLMHIF